MKLEYMTEIESAPEKVWYWLGDPERAMVWQTNVSKIEILEPAREDRGLVAVITLTHHHPGPKGRPKAVSVARQPPHQVRRNVDHDGRSLGCVGHPAPAFETDGDLGHAIRPRDV